MASSALNEMRIYNLAPFWDAEQQREHPWKRWLFVLKHGWSWYREYQAQTKFLEALRPLLDRRFVLIRTYTWPELEYPFPLILIGPPGVYLLYVTPLSGEFRIHENRLLQLGKGKGEPIKPNLVRRTRLLGIALQRFIADRLGLEVPVETRLVFTAPDVYVDTVDAEVRPLLPDGVKGFAESLLNARERLTRLHIRRVVELFLAGSDEEKQEAEEKVGETRRAILASAQEAVRQSPGDKAARRKPTARAAARSDRIAGLTLKQWLILAALLALNILLILAFLALIAFTG